MDNCKTCKKALFNEVWGEYRCTAWKQTIRDVDSLVECPDYIKGEPSISKDDGVNE